LITYFSVTKVFIYGSFCFCFCFLFKSYFVSVRYFWELFKKI